VTVAGGAAFWAGTLTTSLLPIAAEYRTALSISHARNLLIEAPVAGLIVGWCVAYLLHRFADRIPGRRPVDKAVFMSLGALVVAGLAIRGMGLLVQPAHPDLGWFAVGAALDLPRFAILGMAVGLICDRIDPQVHARPAGRDLAAGTSSR
jgi:hypothetical protein